MLLNSWYNYGINQKTSKKWSKILEKYRSRLSSFHETSISILAKAYPILLKIKTKEILLFAEAFIRRCSAKKSFRPVILLKRESNKDCNYIIKENLAQVLSCEFCKVFENTFIHRTPPVTGSVFTVLPSLIKS